MDNEFMLAKIFASINNIKVRSLYVSFCYDKKIGRTDRFKKIDGRLYVSSFYPQTKKISADIERARKLYYELIEEYASEYFLAKDLSKFLPFLTVYAIYETLIAFKFQKHTLSFIEAFEQLLKDKKRTRNEND
ncbi:hypothetical protein [Campylobacter californiensis]|uniref:hypothetical protein n=1 Tax=Campylobacter californiensis TaxID=1032243 RepID=UPI0014761873|nr:hypothetical protein [Campylobacter sp. RM12916]MBE3610531.1 hypothetical protein [Campylobacter sp. RM12916]